MEKLSKFLNDIEPSRILDVGTGTGSFIDMINTTYTGYEEVIGIDTMGGAIESATKKFEDNDKVSFQKMDASCMSFDDESFDLVCLSNSLHHLDNIRIVVKEMDRIVKVGGYIVFAEMMRNRLSDQQQSHLLLHEFAAKIDRMQGHVHNDTYRDDKILEVCKENSDLAFYDNWILKYERKINNSTGEIQWYLDAVDRFTDKVNDNDIFAEGENIKEYISKNGFASCPTMIVVMKK